MNCYLHGCNVCRERRTRKSGDLYVWMYAARVALQETSTILVKSKGYFPEFNSQ